MTNTAETTVGKEAKSFNFLVRGLEWWGRPLVHPMYRVSLDEGKAGNDLTRLLIVVPADFKDAFELNSDYVSFVELGLYMKYASVQEVFYDLSRTFEAAKTGYVDGLGEFFVDHDAHELFDTRVFYTVAGMRGYGKGIRLEPPGRTRQQLQEIDFQKLASSVGQGESNDLARLVEEVRGYGLGLQVRAIRDYGIGLGFIPRDDEEYQYLVQGIRGITTSEELSPDHAAALSAGFGLRLHRSGDNVDPRMVIYPEGMAAYILGKQGGEFSSMFVDSVVREQYGIDYWLKGDYYDNRFPIHIKRAETAFTIVQQQRS